MTKNTITTVMVSIVELLTPLSTEERHRVIRASLALLGDTPGIDSPKGDSSAEADYENALPPRAKNWLKQNGLSLENLEETFHLNGEVFEVIASDIPGKSDKEKTYNAYILTGISRLLSIGEPNFDDKQARDLCKSLGCLNEGNHSYYMKNKGNEIAGSKEKGWTLTAPGLKQGAMLVQTLNKKL